MKAFIRIMMIAMVAVLLLCAAGCRDGKKESTSGSGNGTAAPAVEATTPTSGDSTAPTAVEGVEDWTTTGTQIPSSQTGNQQSGGQTGNEQTGNQTGDQQTGNQTGTQEQPEASGTLTLEAYNAMSTSEQQAYFQSFATVDAFYEWLEKAEKDYEERHKNDTVTGDGTLDLGDYIGK